MQMITLDVRINKILTVPVNNARLCTPTSLYYNTPMKNNYYVKASELGDYVYCPRGWWLRFNGKLGTTEDMIQGTREHNTLAEDLQIFNRKKVIAWLFIAGGILLLIIYFLISVFIK